MKAAVYNTYGNPEVVTIQNIPTPEIGENEVRVRIKSTSVTSGDARLRAANPFVIRFMYGLTSPKNPVLGHEYAGIVDEVGSKVSTLKVGDHVVGSMGMQSGSHAEFIRVNASSNIAKIDNHVPFELAGTSVVSFLTADYFLNQIDLEKTKTILIHGASGSIGTMAIQIAKIHGLHVTAVCSTKHAERIKALGADEVIDYTKSDFTKSDSQYDAVFSTVGKTTFKACLPILNEEGTFLASEAVPTDYFSSAFLEKKTGKKFIAGVSKPTPESFLKLVEYLNNDLIKSTIHNSYSLSNIQEAYTLVDGKHKFGNVAINVA